MLDLKHRSFQDRIRRWKSKLEVGKPAHLERVRRYAGPGYTGEKDRSQYDPISYTFNGISKWLPLMNSGPPRFAVGSSRREGMDQALMLEAGLNRIVQQGDWVTTNEMLAADFYIGPYGVSLTTLEPIPGFSPPTAPRYWPTRHRLPPFDFVGDSDEYPWTNWRFMGHRDVMDHDDALKLAEDDPDSGWDYDALMSIQPGIVDDKGRGTRRVDGGTDIEDRQQFEFYAIWVPEVDAEALKEIGYDPGEEDELGRTFDAEGGYHGAIFYIIIDHDLPGYDSADKGEHRFIRAPHMYYGPSDGPYTLYPGYVVPDEALPLAPDVATSAQSEAANTGARALLNAIARYKSVTFVASATPDIEDALRDARDGDVVPIRDADSLQNRIQTEKIGGPTQELVASASYVHDLQQMASGMGDGQFGEVTGKGSATENAIAAKASGTKVEYLGGKFRRCVEKDGRKAAWFLDHEERVEIALGKEHGFAILRGGEHSAALRNMPEMHEAEIARYGSLEAAIAIAKRKEKKERERRPQDPFEAMVFSVEDRSMGRTADGMAQAQANGMREVLSWLPQVLVMNPHLRADEALRWISDVSDVRGLERIFDLEILQLMRSLALQTQIPPSEPLAEPRLLKDRPPQMMLGQGTSRPGAQQQTPALGQPMKPAFKPAGPGGSNMPGRSTGSLAGSNSKGAA